MDSVNSLNQFVHYVPDYFELEYMLKFVFQEVMVELVFEIGLY